MSSYRITNNKLDKNKEEAKKIYLQLASIHMQYNKYNKYEESGNNYYYASLLEDDQYAKIKLLENSIENRVLYKKCELQKISFCFTAIFYI